MPLYQYQCDCGKITERFRTLAARNRNVICFCGQPAQRIISLPNLITDTNFGLTGKVDTRLGDKPVEGRQDWKKRLKEKGLIETDRHYGEKLSTLDDRTKQFQVTADIMNDG